MRPILFLFLLLCCVPVSIAQNCASFCVSDNGHVLIYKTYNPKGKLLSTTHTTMENVSVTGTGVLYRIHSIEVDTRGEVLYDNSSMMKCEEGRFYADMCNYLTPAMMQIFDGYPFDYLVNDFIEIPIDMEVGEMLPDGKITVVGSNGKKSIENTLEVKYRQVEGAETVQTPMGSFRCFKIVYLVIEDDIKHTETLVTEWIGVGIGLVKREEYTPKGKLISVTELTNESIRLASR